MAEVPFIFGGNSMLRLLDGSKTQTRRVVTVATSLFDGRRLNRKQAPWDALRFDEAWIDPGPSPAGNAGPYLKVPRSDETGERLVHRIYPRAGVGDIIWCREAWGAWPHMGGGVQHATLRYRTDGPPPDDEHNAWRWRSPIHMPRWACRCELDVAAVRPERLHHISEADAEAEGVERSRDGRLYPGTNAAFRMTHRAGFRAGWDVLNAERGFGWDDNPWVWVYDLRRRPYVV